MVEKRESLYTFSSEEIESFQKKMGKMHRFIGISLAGGKTDKACVAVIEYYPQHKKIFLTRLYDHIINEPSLSADQKIYDIVSQHRQSVEYLSYDTPLQLPLCLQCELACPGYEKCQEEHVVWMRDYTTEKNKKKKPKKLFTPYTQRCIELYVNSSLEEPFYMHHALGSNVAPLMARARFLQRRLQISSIEVYTPLSLWRIGRSLGIIKRHLRFHKHSVGGDESRRAILKSLGEHNVAFVYDQDVRLMIENNHAFESFIGALTAFLKFKSLTEKRPTHFPAKETWVEIPLPSIRWDE